MRKSLAFAALTAVASIVLMGAACQRLGTANPIGAACAGVQDVGSKPHAIEQCAFALYGSFVIAEEQAAKIAADPNLPKAARDALIAADEVAKPVADRMYDAIVELDKVRAEATAPGTTDEKLARALANLESWVARARGPIEALVNAVKGARS